MAIESQAARAEWSSSARGEIAGTERGKAAIKINIMIITRTELITICDRFLTDELSKEEIVHFARSVMFDDEDKYECEDELVEEILSQWDNIHTQSKINKTSMQFLKNTLQNLN